MARAGKVVFMIVLMVALVLSGQLAAQEAGAFADAGSHAWISDTSAETDLPEAETGAPAESGSQAQESGVFAQTGLTGSAPEEKEIVSIDPPEVYPQSARLHPLSGPSVQIIRISTGQGLGHTSVALGGNNDNIAMSLTGATAADVQWSSSNPAVFTVSWTASSATVTAVGEGYGRLKLQVRTTDNQVLTDEANVSIYTPMAENMAGRVTSITDIYRGADTITTHRGQAAAGQSVAVVGACGPWYYVLFPDTVTFIDDQPANHYGYLLKTKVTFPVTGIQVSPKTLSMNAGATATLTATVSPGYASNKKVTWSSSNTKVATVDASGKVVAKATGTATITSKTSDGGRTDSCGVAVKLPAPAISAIKSGGNLKTVVTWNTVAGSASYTLLYATAQNGTYKVAKAGLTPAAKARTVSFTHTAPGYKVFYYRVVSVHANAACNSDNSAAKSFNTLLPPASWRVIPMAVLLRLAGRNLLAPPGMWFIDQVKRKVNTKRLRPSKRARIRQFLCLMKIRMW